MSPQTINVLLIEDDEDDYIVTRDFLNDIAANKYHVEWVNNHANALDIMLKNNHDVVLLDFTLGGSTGLEILKEAAEKKCRVPIILLTGRDDPEIDLEAMKAGAADFLIKGQINEFILERSIRYVLKHAQTIEALRESEERYALAATGANDGLWDWNLKTNTIYYSPRWKSMLGYTQEEIGNSPQEWFKRVHASDLEKLESALLNHQSMDQTHIEVEYRIQHKDGTVLWMLTRGTIVYDDQAKASRIAGSQTDITQRKLAEERLLFDAFHDALTHLPNRALFMDRLERLLDRTKRYKNYKFAVLFIDIDRFKVVNDSLGHAIGDQLLVEISKRLERCLRSGDTVARLGGDEFTILLDGVEGIKTATEIANRIHDQLSSSFNLGVQNVFITASIGITLSESEYIQAGDFLRDADTAMYKAKLSGKARHEIFDRTMHTRVMETLNLEADLRRAIEREEFHLHYQPIISVATGKVVKMEALLRWTHPQSGILPPMHFIPLAEETGMIFPIGEWVLKTVCQQSRTWSAAGFSNLRIALNFSARQFQQKNLPELIKKIMQTTNTSPPMIELEITESIAMEDVGLSIKILNELRAMNIPITIDDFGIGYSSLSCLKLFPMDAIKIDRSFIHDIPASQINAAITTAIISLGHGLGLKVVAEGVETKEQLNFLKDHACDEIQGYLYSSAVPAEEATKLLEKMY